MKKVDRNEEVSGVEVQKIFKDIFLLFYYELKVSFVTDFKKWQREKDNHIYIALRLAQIIVNDLLDIKFTLDQMLTVRISSYEEMENIILESELCRFEPNIKNVKNCTCTIQAKDKDILEITCIYGKTKKEKRFEIPRDKRLLNPEVNTDLSGASLWTGINQIKGGDIYAFYTEYIQRNFNHGIKDDHTIIENIVWNHFNCLVCTNILCDFNRFYDDVFTLDSIYDDVKYIVSPNNDITKESLWSCRYHPLYLLLKKFENYFDFYKRIFSLELFKNTFMKNLEKLKNKTRKSS